jgi:choline dehydrogenase-like flavoprotein
LKRVVIVGSGASGVHFALTAVRKGHDVLLLDVGHQGRDTVNPGDNFAELKQTLADPTRYFLGEQFEAVVLPGNKNEYYGFPPSKNFVFTGVPRVRNRTSGFAPLLSFARGGLAEAWTAGAYAFNDHDLEAFPFGYGEMQPYYAEVANRIGINGTEDDLSQFFPVPGPLQEPLRLDEHSNLLLQQYGKKRDRLNSLGCYLGRSRVATLSRDREGRGACRYLGRCLWGCPAKALYTPSITLEECQRYPNFRYQPGALVRHFVCDPDRRVTGVVCESLPSGERFSVPVDQLVLAAGTLMSSKIFLESLRLATGQVPRLCGLMDNRQIMVPFVNLRMIGRRPDPASYQYHQLAMGFEENTPQEYVHCQITTLKTALIHPIVQSVPFDLRTALSLFQRLHAALGLVNVNLCDTRRKENYLTLEAGDGGAAPPRLVIHYEPPAAEARLISRVLARLKRALRILGCVVPPGMSHVRPMGASVHYAGTIPMSHEPRPLTSSPDGQSHDFPNLWFADGTTFPFLPAKNLTCTLMANAIRVAEKALC